ncbi:MAG TPA: 4Fe-4S dicluster domain-containing protein [Rhodanobacteraceae bacterium]|nr:4Fe-4S dicluster domain-containing protein [Rhodanobacteraceae bacterium]
MTALPAPSKKKLGLVIDLNTCVGCHACAMACKEWNDGGHFGPLPDSEPYGAGPQGVWFNRVHTYEVTGDGRRETRNVEEHSGDTLSSPVSRFPSPVQMVHFPRSCLHCETPDCVTVCPTGASYKRAEDGIVLVDEDKCIGCQLCAWACPYGAREISLERPHKQADGRPDKRGTMQKCTLCVDRIYNEALDESDRQPACVMACPTRARHFGDLGDPKSAISQLVAQRGGYELMPEFGYRPVNKYLPPRPRRDGSHIAADATPEETVDASELPPLLRWMDRVLSR